MYILEGFRLKTFQLKNNQTKGGTWYLKTNFQLELREISSRVEVPIIALEGTKGDFSYCSTRI